MRVMIVVVAALSHLSYFWPLRTFNTKECFQSAITPESMEIEKTLQ